jgi:hypothetical protein
LVFLIFVIIFLTDMGSSQTGDTSQTSVDTTNVFTTDEIPVQVKLSLDMPAQGSAPQ